MPEGLLVVAALVALALALFGVGARFGRWSLWVLGYLAVLAALAGALLLGSAT